MSPGLPGVVGPAGGVAEWTETWKSSVCYQTKLDVEVSGPSRGWSVPRIVWWIRGPEIRKSISRFPGLSVPRGGAANGGSNSKLLKQTKLEFDVSGHPGGSQSPRVV